MACCANPFCWKAVPPWSGRGRKPLYCSAKCREYTYRQGLSKVSVPRRAYGIRGHDPALGEAAVYYLRDPETDEVRYVGSTTQRLMLRALNHAWDNPGSAKQEWCASTSFVIDVVEYVPAQLRRACEQRWLEHARAQHWPLFNTHNADGPLTTSTHCVHGHEYTDDNTYLRRSKKNQDKVSRECRECMRERSRRYEERKRKR